METTTLYELLGEVYRGRERLTTAEIRQAAVRLSPPRPLRTLVEALPDGEYERDQAHTVLARIQAEEGIWRDENRTSAADLDRAMAQSGGEGQYDDRTGNEAREGRPSDQPGAAEEGYAEPDEPGHRTRPGFEDQLGPH